MQNKGILLTRGEKVCRAWPQKTTRAQCSITKKQSTSGNLAFVRDVLLAALKTEGCSSSKKL